MKKKPSIEMIMALVIMLLTAIMAIDGFVFQDIPPEAAKYPVFVFCVIMAAGVAEIIRCVREQKKEEKEAKPVFENPRNFLVVCGMIVGYGILVWLLGFVIATILFTIGFTCYSRLKHLVLFNGIMALVIVGIYFLFERVLQIFLPVGLLFENLL